MNRSPFVHEMFSSAAGRHGGKVAIEGSRNLTYDELENMSSRIAHQVIAQGVKKEDLVVIYAKDREYFIAGILGILKAGAAFVPLSPELPDQRLESMLQQCTPSWALVEPAFIQKFQPVADRNGITTFTAGSTVEAHPPELLSDFDPNGISYIYFTSGSTGKPKPIAGRLRAIDHFIRWEIGALNLQSGTRVSQLISPMFDAFLRDMFVPLCSGGTICIPPDEEVILDGNRLGKWITNQKINLVHTVPSVLRLLFHDRYYPDQFSSLKWMLLAGEPLLPVDVKKWYGMVGESGGRLVNLYGPSETTMTKFVYFASPEDQWKHSIPIGKPIEGARALIIDDSGKPCPSGRAGEIYIRTPYRSLGYYRQPELTQAVFLPNPFSSNPEDLIYKTGDLGWVLEDGNFELLGRKDHQVKIRGVRIELGEIESALADCESVDQAVVADHEDDQQNKFLCAYVVPKPGGNVQTVRQQLSQRLPEYMLPSAYVVLETLPRSANGKIERKALPQPRKIQQEKYVAPRTMEEELLCRIFEEVLKREQVGIHESFFEMGGHSLLATQVMSRLRQVFKLEMPLRDLFETPTVSSLADRIKQSSGHAGVSLPMLVPAASTGNLPLSYAQERLWFIQKLNPASPAYNIPTSLRLAGNLYVQVLERSWSEIIRRHQVLRTTFVEMDGKPVQRINPPFALSIPVVDLSGLPQSEQEELLPLIIRAEAVQSFDLQKGPLVRGRLLRLSEKENIALLTMHHIVSDGWSTSILVRELGLLYQAYAKGQMPPLEELKVQYADYAVWQRTWLQDEIMEKQLAYWREQLAGIPARLELPIRGSRPAIQTHNGSSIPVQLDPDLVQGLKSLSRHEGSTLFMALLAGFKALLCRYTGEKDIVVGTPIANRNRVEVEGLIGFFANTLALRTRIQAEKSYLELLKTVRETALQAHMHQDMPFEKLVEYLQPERDLSRSPLFQVMFVLHNTPKEELQLDGLTIIDGSRQNSTAKFELTLKLTEGSLGASGSIEYNIDLFERQKIEEFSEHLRRLLKAIVEHPEMPILELPLLSEGESRQIVQEWNRTAVGYPMAESVCELIEEQVRRTPQAMAVVHKQGGLNYQELNRRANQLARYLKNLGIGPEVLVGICMEPSLEMVVAVLGVLKSGGAYVPLDPNYPAERLQYMLEDAQVAVLLSQERLKAKLGGSAIAVLCLEEAWEEIGQGEGEDFASGVVKENLGYVIYTSGSTGKPKGVGVTHAGLLNYLNWVKSSYGGEKARNSLVHSSLSFDLTVTSLYGPLLWGGTIKLVGEGGDVEGVKEGIVEGGEPLVKITPSHLQVLREMMQEGEEGEGGVWVIGGEALKYEDVRRWQEAGGGGERKPRRRLINEYGPTETVVGCCVYEVEGREESWEKAGAIPIGKPIGNMQMYVLDEGMNAVPVGVAGELYIGGAGVARGYWRRGGQTGERFVPNPYGGEGERLYRTGDRGRYLEDGNIVYLGRIDQQIKLRGYRIELGEIEAAICEYDEVKQSIVALQEERDGNKLLVGYVVPSANAADISIKDLRIYLQRRLPAYMVPSRFGLVKELPLNQHGKIDFKALSELEIRKNKVADVDEHTPIEEIICGIWTEVLKIAPIGTYDNFFDLGGHSLLATQIMSRVNNAFSCEIPLLELFRRPTVHGLAECVEQSLRHAPLARPRLQHAERGELLPLSYSQERLWFIEHLQPGNAAYIMATAVSLRGQIQLRALIHSFSEVVQRHDVLRSCFLTIADKALQRTNPSATLYVPMVDLTALPETQREEAAKQLAEQESKRSFDLGRGTCVRGQLLKLGSSHHIALVTMHHIVSDGWSMMVFVREMGALYGAYCNGEASPLPPLKFQYGDYAAWQQQWFQGEVLQSQLQYWKQKLAGINEMGELPIDFPRPEEPAYEGAAIRFRLDHNLADEIRILSRKHNSTLYMTLLTALKLLLYRCTGWGDIVVGTPIANRHHLESEELIGCFVNTLVLRTRLYAGQTFLDALKQVQKTVLEAHMYQDMPFEKLVEELQPERKVGKTPLFQVSFTMDNASPESVTFPGLTIEGIDTDRSVIPFDLILRLQDTGDGLLGSLKYRTELFTARTAEHLVNSFVAIVKAVLANPETSLKAIKLPDDKSEHFVSESFGKFLGNGTEEEYGGGKCITEYIEEQVKERPEAVAVVGEGMVLSYQGLEGRANQVGHYLQKLGVGPEVLVGVCLERSVELLVVLLGIMKAGGAYLPLEPSYPGERLRYLVEDGKAEVVVSGKQWMEKVQWEGGREGGREGGGERKEGGGIGRVKYVDWEQEREKIWEQEKKEKPGCKAGAGNLAYVIYTSGSTGQPKGVMISQGAISNRLLWMKKEFGLDGGTVVVQKTVFSFDASVWELFVGLMAGGRVVMARAGGQQDSRYLVELMKEEEVGVLQAVPSMLQVLVEEEGLEECGNLRQVFSGGEALGVEVQERLWERLGTGVELVNLYGPTEASIDSSYYRCRESKGESRVAIGRPIGNVKLYVVDEEGELVGAGVAGELYIGGAGLGRGYRGRGGWTGERFVPDGYSGEAGGRLYRSGDRVRYRGDGELEYLGRVDEQVKIRGYRIEVGEIEAVLHGHGGVREAVVVVRDEGGESAGVGSARAGHGNGNGQGNGRRRGAGGGSGKRLVAYVAVEGEVKKGELKRYLQERLPEYMVPSAIEILREMPRLANGKMDRGGLPEPGLGERDEPAAAARGPVEEIIAGIWSEVLGLEQVGIHDNFFDLGGHSLRVIQIVTRLRNIFQVELSIRALFDHPTIAGLASHIEATTRLGKTCNFPAISRTTRQQPIELSYAQESLWFLDQLRPGNTAYNLPNAIRLKGKLQAKALEHSLSEIIRRHEALRTSFHGVAGKALQCIDEPRPVRIPIVDLSELPEAASKKIAQTLVSKAAWAAFDLGHAPLLRMRLLRMQDEEHVALMVMHHMVSDGWSINIFVHELATLYEAYARNLMSPLQELELQYADYATWQRERLLNGGFDRQLEYWKRQLDALPAPLNLSSARLASEKRNYLAETKGFELNPDDLAKLRQMARREGATLYMVLLALFKVVLAYDAAQTDIVVGTPVANRNWLEKEDLIGFFANTIVLRTDLSGQPDFLELLRRVREVTLQAHVHQDLPFARLVQELQPQWAAHRKEIFRVSFSYQNVPDEPPQFFGLAIQPFQLPAQRTPFDLILHFKEMPSSVLGTFQYSTDVFERSFIVRFIARIKELIAFVAAEPHAPSSAMMEILANADRLHEQAKAEQFHDAHSEALRRIKRQRVGAGQSN